MNKAWRCKARDGSGHRCNQKEGHDGAHSAFGKLWDDAPLKKRRSRKDG